MPDGAIRRWCRLVGAAAQESPLVLLGLSASSISDFRPLRAVTYNGDRQAVRHLSAVVSAVNAEFCDARASVDHVGSGLSGGVRGAADPNFAWAVRSFASLFPTRRLGGGALSVYLDGRPVVDVWTGWADRRGSVPWSADTGVMVFSATKGLASTVIHRLVDRGLLAYDVPVAEYWPKNVLGKSQAAVEARCHGLRPGGGSSRRTINPIIAHLIMASLVSGSRS